MHALWHPDSTFCRCDLSGHETFTLKIIGRISRVTENKLGVKTLKENWSKSCFHSYLFQQEKSLVSVFRIMKKTKKFYFIASLSSLSNNSRCRAGKSIVGKFDFSLGKLCRNCVQAWIATPFGQGW